MSSTPIQPVLTGNVGAYFSFSDSEKPEDGRLSVFIKMGTKGRRLTVAEFGKDLALALADSVIRTNDRDATFDKVVVEFVPQIFNIVSEGK